MEDDSSLTAIRESLKAIFDPDGPPLKAIREPKKTLRAQTSQPETQPTKPPVTRIIWPEDVQEHRAPSSCGYCRRPIDRAAFVLWRVNRRYAPSKHLNNRCSRCLEGFIRIAKTFSEPWHPSDCCVCGEFIGPDAAAVFERNFYNLDGGFLGTHCAKCMQRAVDRVKPDGFAYPPEKVRLIVYRG